jgi:hypothetical protein
MPKVRTSDIFVVHWSGKSKASDMYQALPEAVKRNTILPNASVYDAERVIFDAMQDWAATYNQVVISVTGTASAT